MKVTLITHTPEPEKLIAGAANLCYSPKEISEILEDLSDSNIQRLVTKLADMGHECYDSETEVLTDRGFVKWPDVKKEDKIGVVNPQNIIFEGFQVPKRLVSYKYKGDMIHFKNNFIDLMVTPNHKIYASLSNSGRRRINPKFELLKASDITNGRYPMETYKKPMRMSKISFNSNLKQSVEDIKYRLYGFFIGDGHSRKGNAIYFKLKKQRKIDFLKELASELNLKLEYLGDNEYAIRHEGIGIQFRNMFYNKNKEKTFPYKFFNMSYNQYKEFTMGLIESDGSISHKDTRYFSTSVDLLDKIQALNTLNGVASHIRKAEQNGFGNKPCYNLSYMKRNIYPHINDQRSRSGMDYEIVQYEGDVYCATVPTGLLIVRRNEQVVLSGNSPFEHISFTFGIEGVSRSLTHQLVRHRIGSSYSQKSQRYVIEGSFQYIIPPAIESNPKAKERFIKAMKDDHKAYDDIFNELLEDQAEKYLKEKLLFKGKDYSCSAVDELIGFDEPFIKKELQAMEKKVAEDARYILPNACETKIVVTMNARALFNFFEKRCCNRAQWEIRNLADEMLRLVKEVAPTVFKNAGAPCTYSSCPEGSMTCGNPRR